MDAESLIAGWASAASPPPAMSVSEWADAKRVLPETSAARGARWRTESTPYLRGIMDSVLERDVKKIAVRKASQTGGPLALDTPLATPCGWTTMGDIRVGDSVFDEHGRPCRVVGVGAVLNGEPCYAISFSDGSEIIADAGHPWSIEADASLAMSPGQLGRPKGKLPPDGTRRGIVTTEQIARSFKRGKRNMYAVRVSGPLSLPARDLPVDPYVLGVWLGDGHSWSAQIAQDKRDDEELTGYLRGAGADGAVIIDKRSQPGSVTIALERPSEERRTHCPRGHEYAVVGRVSGRSTCAECHRQQSRRSQYGSETDPIVTARDGIALRLARLGLLKTRATSTNHKHVPPQYLRASAAQRLALLQGLMDTDGTCDKRGRCEFSTTNVDLRNGVLELVRSLGLKPTVRPYVGRTKRGKEGRTYECSDGWKIAFIAYADRPVFRLKRKRDRQPDRVGRRTTETERRRIVNVRSVPPVPVCCIAVDSPSHLYLAGLAMIPTHNSEALHNIVGYFIEYDPCAMLFVHPTAEVAEAWSKDRLGDMIRTTPALRRTVRTKRAPRESHEAESTLSLKVFTGGYLALGGANTPNTFARWSVRVAIGDDVDRFPAVVKSNENSQEGDPADLLMNRTETFADGLGLFVSTPTLKGGRIDTLYERSDRRKFFIACPACGREDFISWNDPRHLRVAFDDRDPETARLECPSHGLGGCGAWLTEADRRAMLVDGAWRPTAVPQERGLVGFHLPVMLSTLGDVSLAGIVEQWLSARAKGKESLRVFVNTKLAEGWEDRGAKMEPHALLSRREDYGDGVEVPAAAVAITAGVDVQADRFELQAIAWGPASERWVVDYRVIPGDPKRVETRAALLEALSRRYAHALGPQLPILATCVDSGYATEEVYDFVLAYQARRIYATKGFAGKSGEPIVGKPSEKRYGKAPRPVRLYPINVDDAKAEIMSALALQVAGPGAFHFPSHLETVNEEYFAQLCAERRETRYNRGGIATHSVWVLDRERNEALDTAVLSLAAFRLLNPNLRQMADQIAAAAQAARVAGPSAPNSPTPAPAVLERRVTRSSYLTRVAQGGS